MGGWLYRYRCSKYIRWIYRLYADSECDSTSRICEVVGHIGIDTRS